MSLKKLGGSKDFEVKWVMVGEFLQDLNPYIWTQKGQTLKFMHAYEKN